MKYQVLSVIIASLWVNLALSQCCDEDCLPGGAAVCDFAYNTSLCGTPTGDTDGYNCDPECGTPEPQCTSIPLDGGLSLLALAGGGLATAAMRRRREEEEAAQEAA